MELMLICFWITLVFALLALYPAAMEGLQTLLKDVITVIVMVIAKIIISIRRVIAWIRRL